MDLRRTDSVSWTEGERGWPGWPPGGIGRWLHRQRLVREDEVTVSESERYFEGRKMEPRSGWMDMGMKMHVLLYQLGYYIFSA